MSLVPSGYDPQPLYVTVKIKDANGTLKYTYESPQVKAGGSEVQDFTLLSWKIHGGIGTDFGNATIVINDPSGLLYDTTNPDRPLKIKGQWSLEIWCGQSYANLTKWFNGIIQDPENETSYNQNKYTIYAIGKLVQYTDLTTILKFFQKKQSDGLTLDDTDTNAKCSELVKKLLTSKDHYGNPSRDLLSVDVTNVDDIDVKVASLEKNYESINSTLSQLANMSGCIFGLDPDDNFWFRYRGSKSSGFLFTNNRTSLQTQNWSKSKFAILRKIPTGYVDTTIGYGISDLIGVGCFHDTKDYEQTSANALLDLSSKYFAFPITPTKDNISKIAPYLSEVGTPSKDLGVSIISNNGSGAPLSTSNRKKITVMSTTLQALGSGEYKELSFDITDTEPNQKVFLMFDKYPDSSNPIKIDYQTGSGEYYDSTDGVSWTLRTGNVKIRTYHSEEIVEYVENVVAKKTFGRRREEVIPIQDLNEDSAIQALIGISDSIGKTRRTYKPIMISAVSSRLDLGKTIKIVDKNTGLDIVADLIAFDLGGSSTDKQNSLGASEIRITVEKVFYRA
ncbi:MAG: hypothetical protein HZC29_02135 [Thaumarchaeota archaeon]|nr:hypothetical protein [Nitrososphaerota archaeon]